jgi:hypothetical protein
MKNTTLTEGLDYHDLDGILLPTVSVDEYAAHMGSDDDIITLAFIVRSEQAGNDLVDWFERGYQWVLDASLSDGELSPNKYLVFVEIARRSAAPGRIVDLLSDLVTLCDIPISDWTVVVDEEDYPAEVGVLEQVIVTSPHEYRVDDERDAELNEMRTAAGLKTKKIYVEDAEIKALKAKAGL